MSHQQIVKSLNLHPHPEGGFYREIFRDNRKIKVDLKAGYVSRNVMTNIYYLLPRGSVSKFHRLPWTETWIVLQGGTVRLHLADDSGYTTADLSSQNAHRQILEISPGCWFAAEVIEGEFVLSSCIVSPGFEFEDLEYADKDQLLSVAPELRDRISEFI